MTAATLLTPNDVREFSSIRKLNFAPCDFDHIYQEELSLARACIGIDLWQAMIAAKIDYSASVEYVAGASYLTGDVVIYSGVLKVALSDTNKDPSFSAFWASAPRFEGACAAAYEGLYCNYLGPLIANTILANRMPFIRAHISANGIINTTGTNQQKATDQEFNQLVKATQAAADQSFKNLEWYMKQDSQTALKESCLAGWPAFSDALSCDSTYKTRLKRTGWYDFG